MSYDKLNNSIRTINSFLTIYVIEIEKYLRL